MIIAWHISNPLIFQLHRETSASALKLTNHMLSSPLPSSPSPLLSITTQEMEEWPSSYKVKARSDQLSRSAVVGVSWGVRINRSINSSSAVIMWGERCPGPRETGGRAGWGVDIMKSGRNSMKKCWEERRLLACRCWETHCCSSLPILFPKASTFNCSSLFLLSHSPPQSDFSSFHVCTFTQSLMRSLWTKPLFYH